uniref:Bestrophin homolog n=1 Tax=Steinernema glaseri TaxID=37863 RepID=A0A1I7YNY6_9BILA
MISKCLTKNHLFLVIANKAFLCDYSPLQRNRLQSTPWNCTHEPTIISKGLTKARLFLVVANEVFLCDYSPLQRNRLRSTPWNCTHICIYPGHVTSRTRSITCFVPRVFAPKKSRNFRRYHEVARLHLPSFFEFSVKPPAADEGDVEKRDKGSMDVSEGKGHGDTRWGSYTCGNGSSSHFQRLWFLVIHSTIKRVLEGIIEEVAIMLPVLCLLAFLFTTTFWPEVGDNWPPVFHNSARTNFNCASIDFINVDNLNT